LKENDLSSSYDVLRNHDIDVETFSLLTQEDLERMGVSIGHIKRILVVIRRLQEFEEAKKPKPARRKSKGTAPFSVFFFFLFSSQLTGFLCFSPPSCRWAEEEEED